MTKEMTREDIKEELRMYAGLIETADTPEKIEKYIENFKELRDALVEAINRDELLLKIAKHHSYALRERGDLTLRNNDEEDFIEISVSSIDAMLVEAYDLGKRKGAK